MQDWLRWCVVVLAALSCMACGDVLRDTGQRAARSCTQLFKDTTKSGICKADGARLAIGARGQAVRVRVAQLDATAADATAVIEGDEELPSRRAKGRWVIVEVRATNRGQKRMSWSKILLWGNLLRVRGRFISPDPDSAVLVGLHRNPGVPADYLKPEASDTYYLAYDVPRRLLPSLKRGSGVVEFVSPQQINRRRNAVGSARRLGVIRVPPLA